MTALRLVPENAVDSATLTATPTALSTLPVTNLQLIARDRFFRSGSTSATQVFQGQWSGSVKTITCWGIFPYRGSVSSASLIGTTARLQLYSDAAWTTQIYDSGNLDFYADGVGWGSFAWGVGSWGTGTSTDPLAGEAAFVKFIAANVAQSFTITLTNPTGVARTWDVKRVWLGAYVEAPYNPDYGLTVGYQSATTRSRTRGGSQRPSRGDRWRVMKFDMGQATAADKAIWLDMTGRLDMSQPMLVSVFPDATGRQFRDHTMEGTFEGLSPNAYQGPAQFSQNFSIEET